MQILNLINNNNSKEIMVFSPLKKETNRNLTFNENKSNINYGFDFKEYLETDIDDLIFEEIIERDKRTFCEYFKEQLKSNLMVIDAIYNNEPLKPRVIKLTLYIINIDLYFIINALFINEEFISDVFSSEKNDIIEIIKRSFDRVFYTTLVKVILNYIINCFFIEEKKIKVILKSKKMNIKEVKYKIIIIMKQVLNRLIYFIIFSFIITFFSLYYISCFNYRYYYITKEWIQTSIFIIIFMEILSIITIFIQTSFRFLGLKLGNEKIYKFSLIFS